MYFNSRICEVSKRLYLLHNLTTVSVTSHNDCICDVTDQFICGNECIAENCPQVEYDIKKNIFWNAKTFPHVKMHLDKPVTVEFSVHESVITSDATTYLEPSSCMRQRYCLMA